MLSDMRVTTYSDPEVFLVQAEPLLRSDPFSPNVIATVTTRIASGAVPGGPDHLWVTIERNDAEVVGLAMHTPPHNMFVSRMPEEAALVLAREMADSGRNLPGVNGAVASTRVFARAWEQSTGCSSTLARETRMYRLVELRWPEAVAGQAHRAETSRDLGLVTEWFAAFHDEAQSHAPVDDWAAMAQRRMDAGDLHLWHAEGVPVALAGVTGAVAGVARVGPVYTPDRWRGNGYGSSVTAAATSAALGAGAENVVLYTDMANSISNSIYQRIGYRSDHDAEERTFSN
jgi:RimJ/RimL family protein N-acetyltransferase